VSGPRILLVDDDPALRALVRMTLPIDETEVVEAAGADEAVTLLDGSSFDLVLLDWTMPGKSGAEVLRTLHDLGREIPVIVLTAELNPSYRALATSLGADTFLTKPFSPLELLGEIERLLHVG
jgi:two-component system, OmpR family, phosphate regulon response regulator PhoB